MPQSCDSAGRRPGLQLANLSVHTQRGECAGLTTTKHALLRLVKGGEELRNPIVELSVPNTRLKYTAGQWVFVCIPKLGLLHWHPFTISSSARDEKMTLHLDCGGRWTGEVAKLAAQQSQVKVSLKPACYC
jgi:predicted ferric reductase